MSNTSAPIYLRPQYATCNKESHSPTATKTTRVARLYLEDIQEKKWTGTVNFVALSATDMRMAQETSEKSNSCGQRVNGHCHLGKVKAENGRYKQYSAYAAGQAIFANGILIELNNRSGTYRPPRIKTQADTDVGLIYYRQMLKCFRKLGLSKEFLSGVPYDS